MKKYIIASLIALLLSACEALDSIPTSTPFVAPLFQTLTAAPSETPKPTFTVEPTKSPEEHAWNACRLFIERELKLSPFDAQEYNPAGVIKTGDNYLVDVYYAVNNVTYSCYLTQEANGDWRLVDLSIKE